MNEYLKFLSSPKEYVNSCLEWKGSKDKQGYGLIYANGQVYKAHRVAYLLYNGPILSECVCHKCDNPSCVNPDHLFLGTIQDNNKDRYLKGRSKNRPLTGEQSHMAKLSLEQVKEIQQSTDKLKELSIKYGVSLAQISRIKNKKSWKFA